MADPPLELLYHERRKKRKSAAAGFFIIVVAIAQHMYLSMAFVIVDDNLCFSM
jgi:hypothetical protein